jgi:Bifunctional DNA primase/polymerase, N-terminal
MNAKETLEWLYLLLGEVVLLPIPLGQKAPQRSGWHKTTFRDTERKDYKNELIQAVERGGNIGVLLGPASARLFALDLDHDDLPDQWITKHPWLAHTLRTRGRRGCQFWLRLETECRYPNSKAVFKLAETGQEIGELRLGGNGGAQSIIYGIHPAGMPYQIITPEAPREIALADLDELAPGVFVGPAAQPNCSPLINNNHLALSNRQERIRKYLDACEPAISGKGGHKTTYRIVCHIVQGFGLNREAALAAMRYYNQKCDPPWSEKELQHKVDNALRQQCEKPLGYLLSDSTRHQHPPGAPDTQSPPAFSKQLTQDFQNGSSPPNPTESAQQRTAESLQIFYDSPSTAFWIPNDRGGWIKVHTSDVRRHLQERGFKPTPKKGAPVSEIDALLNTIQTRFDIDYADALAGHDRGLHHIEGKRVLVTDSPILIEPHPGTFPLLESIVDNMLGEYQRMFLFGWLKVAIESLRSRTIRPGQALAFVGPRDSGKSLVQSLITQLLGGRSAKPYRYMSGGTTFNSELFTAEHLVIEDDYTSTDIRTRKTLGANIKNVAADTFHSCHPKYRKAIQLPPFWRLTMSLNEEPENLMTLPPLDDSLEDKFIILRCEKHPMPLPTQKPEQREHFMTALKQELPAFVNFLLRYQIPDNLRSERYGVTHYHHAAVVEALNALAPETKLLELIDAEIFKSPAGSHFQGKAADLERRLTADYSAVRSAASRLFTFQSACGTYLGRLQKRYPKRFQQEHKRTGTVWTISPPGSEQV